MLLAEYPHNLTFQQLTKVSDGGGGFTQLWTTKVTVQGFLDTPSSREVFEAQQLNNPLDRNLYFPYRNDITADMRCVYQHHGITETYELIGNPQDQGGQHEVMLVPLKLVK